jgi:pimeloyl-ACP methyl ester carboxylesterase
VTSPRLDRRRLLAGAASLAASAAAGPVALSARRSPTPSLAPVLAPQPTFHRTMVVDGLTIFYREAGDPARPTILLLHGFPSSSHMFRDLIPLLADRFHLVAPDYPGFGQSDAPDPERFPYTFDRMTDVVGGFADALGLDRYAIYVQDYGAPVGFRLATRSPGRIQAIISQNGNAYEAGLTPFWQPLRTYWDDPSPPNEEPLRAFFTPETTRFQYSEGYRQPERISPDAWRMDQLFLDRPGNQEIQLALFYDYRTNLARYPEWHAYFREHQPPALVVWGQNDPIFGPDGARAFGRDLPAAEIHLLDTGHFALEDHASTIAGLMRTFYANRVGA